MTATEYGSLMHTVMQHLDFHGDLSDKGILAQLQNLADREIIDKQHINKIYRKISVNFIFTARHAYSKSKITAKRISF